MSTTFASCLVFFILILLHVAQGVIAATFTVINGCDYTVWPGLLGNAGGLGITGFELPPGGSRAFQVPSGWSGRIWGRTGCVFDADTGHCATADCGSNQVECNGAGAMPPATLAEFTIGGAQDFYDVSLVDGFNLPLQVEAVGGSGACGSTGCAADLNRMCPNELRARDGQACSSACDAFRSPEYCCSGAYGSPSTCKPSAYSAMFKTACPRSYSYAYDDATSTFTCSTADYRVTFCPSTPSQMQRTFSTTPSLPWPAGTSSSSGPPPATKTTSGLEPVLGPRGRIGNSIVSGFITGDSSAVTWPSHFALDFKSPLTSAVALLLILHLLLLWL